jgi:hypothetical protein
MSEPLPAPSGEFLLYTGQNGKVKVECRLQDETLWLTQRLMADLFGVGVPAINKHLKNIFESGELREEEAISILEITTPHGAMEGKVQTQKAKFYNLDAIIAVGYRVNSYQATQFRIWATRTLKEFIIKGFVMDDERLKQGGQAFGKDYFEELLERIREKRRRLVGVLDARSRVTGARRVRSQVAASNQIRQNSNRGGISQMRFSEDASALKREFDTIVWLLSDQEPAEIELFESSAKS